MAEVRHLRRRRLPRLHGPRMSERYPSITAHDLAQAHEYAYQSRKGVAVERILLDLIADLRDAHANWDGYCGASLQAADRAEARLRKVTGDE